jgi:hypothetical protein
VATHRPLACSLSVASESARRPGRRP